MIIDTPHGNFFWTHSNFLDYCEEVGIVLGKLNYHSYEILWLRFVMKELYNKTWNGKEWVSK